MPKFHDAMKDGKAFFFLFNGYKSIQNQSKVKDISKIVWKDILVLCNQLEKSGKKRRNRKCRRENS
jgi:hypothetical protein